MTIFQIWRKVLLKYEFYLSKLRGRLIAGRKGSVQRYVSIPNPQNISFTGWFDIKSFSRLDAWGNNRIVLGKNVMVCRNTTIETAGGDIKIGDNVIIGEYSTLQGQGGVTIEKNVLMASHVHLISNSHDYADPAMAIKYQRDMPKPVVIKENAWIGINVTILSGVTIGRNSVIGTGSVVKDSIPDYCIAVGIPARVVKRYDFETKEWVSVKK